MNKVELRRYVAGLYSGPRWAERVKNMSEQQLYAIYMKTQEQTKTKEANKEKEVKNETLF